MNVNTNLKQYIDNHIRPIYETFDPGHRQKHLDQVWMQALDIVTQNDLDVDMDVLYTIVCYHDLGRIINDKQHHIYSGKFLKADRFILQYFPSQTVQIMSDAVTDHRASNPDEPRNMYGKIIADADRESSPEIVVERFYYGVIKEDPNAFKTQTKDEFFENIYNRIQNKHSQTGYQKIHFEKSKAAIDHRRMQNTSKDEIRKLYNDIYDYNGKG